MMNGISQASVTENSEEKDTIANYRAFGHINWFVGNAKQAASYFVTRMGSREVAYRGLETGSRSLASRVISNNSCTFVLTSPIRGPLTKDGSTVTVGMVELIEFHYSLTKHGDGVKDIAFEVADAIALYPEAVAKGCEKDW